jgi:hypothetical protein
MLAHFLEVRQDEQHKRLQIYQVNKPCLSPPGAAERSPMWLLVIVLLNTVPGLDKIMKLETYATSEECQVERNRIGYEMAAAYPYERDFVIACQLSPKHDS